MSTPATSTPATSMATQGVRPGGIGAELKRKEDVRFLTGKGRYVDDITVPGQLYAYHLTLARGLDAEQPRSIRKVTETT